MAVPKSRRNMRRFAAGNQLDKTTVIICPSCSEPTRPHRICNCGFYGGKAVLPAPRAKVEAAAQ